MFHLRNRKLIGSAVVMALLFVAACSTTSQIAREGEEASKHQNWDGAVYYYLEALANDPGNPRYRMELLRVRQKAAQEHFKRGEALKDMGQYLAAKKELEMAVQLDPTHEFAAQELRKVRHDLEILSSPNGAQSLEEMKKQAARAKVKPPLLNPKSTEPITLSFPKPKPVKEIHKALAKAYGYNVLFDPKLKDDKLSVELKDVTAKRALEIVMQAAGEFYKVLDEHTIIVADDTPQNRRDYEDLVIKTFFLSNADVKDVDKMLRSLVEARRIASNEQLNAITIRDTADKVAIAEKLINTIDKAKAEVMVDVELLEVDSTKLQDLGMRLSTYRFGLKLNAEAVGGAEGKVPLDKIKDITRGDWSINVPDVMINLVKSSTDATALAQPQMRITEGEKGQLHIGTREPIPTTTFNSANTIGGNIVPITSYQYQDVGIKIEVEPRVHHNREITLKVKVEVSNIAGYNSDNQPIIGTRTINTVIRLQDGETNMLVGLYKEDNSSTKTKFPLLSDIPLLGRLFTNDNTSHKTTDLVLTLTPHILRFPDIKEADLEPVWVGTEKRMSFSGNTPRIRSGKNLEGPFDRPSSSLASDRAKWKASARRNPRFKSSARLANPPRPGVSLVPDSGLKKEDIGFTVTPPDGEGTLTGETPPGGGGSSAEAPAATMSRLQLFMQPQVVSIHPGDSASMQLGLAGRRGNYRLKVTASWDPERTSLDGVLYPPGVVEMNRNGDPGDGWVELDLVVTHSDETNQLLATLGFRAKTPGVAPIVIDVQGATDERGDPVTVSPADASLYILSRNPGDGS